MFCRNCGYACPDGSTHCTQCGNPLPPTAYQQLGNPYQAPMSSGGGFNFQGGGQPPMGPKPPNYLVQSILVTIFCCLPFGIAAIVFASQVDSKWNMGDYQGAVNSSNQAKMWSWISFGIVAVFFVIQLIIMAIGASQGGRFQ